MSRRSPLQFPRGLRWREAPAPCRLGGERCRGRAGWRGVWLSVGLLLLLGVGGWRLVSVSKLFDAATAGVGFADALATGEPGGESVARGSESRGAGSTPTGESSVHHPRDSGGHPPAAPRPGDLVTRQHAARIPGETSLRLPVPQADAELVVSLVAPAHLTWEFQLALAPDTSADAAGAAGSTAGPIAGSTAGPVTSPMTSRMTTPAVSAAMARARRVGSVSEGPDPASTGGADCAGKRASPPPPPAIARPTGWRVSRTEADREVTLTVIEATTGLAVAASAPGGADVADRVAGSSRSRDAADRGADRVAPAAWAVELEPQVARDADDEGTAESGWTEAGAANAGLVAERLFWVPVRHSATRTELVPVRACLVAHSPRVAFYADGTSPAPVERDLLRELADMLETRVLPTVHECVGPIADVDGDGRLAVLLTPLLAEWQAGSTPLRAFVRAGDFDVTQVPPHSNHADVIYLNSRQLAAGGLSAVLLHEAAHLACFTRRTAAGLSPATVEWFDEGLAHAVELRVLGRSTNLADRLDRLLAAPQQSSLLAGEWPSRGRDGWRDPGSRGAMALFFHWLSQADAGAFGELVAARQSPREACATVGGEAFPQLFARFCAALHRGDLTAGLRPVGEVWPARQGTARFTLRGGSSCRVICRGLTAGDAVTLTMSAGVTPQLTWLCPQTGASGDRARALATSPQDNRSAPPR